MQSRETKQFLERLFRFNKLMVAHMNKMSNCSPGELKMLNAIEQEQEKLKEEGSDLPGVSPSRISELLMHSKPATSKMLNILEKKEDIERVYSKVDRRAVYIKVTDKGHERAKVLQEEMDHYTNLILERLGPEKTAQLFESMDDLYEAIKAVHEERLI